MSMFVSRSLDYAMRGLICLASSDESLSLRQISEEGHIPKSYLAKVMRTLVRADIVRSGVGVRGGYHLAREAEAISLQSVYEAVEGTFHTIVCNDDTGNCDLVDDCTQVQIWAELEEQILRLLAEKKLSDFIRSDDQGQAQFIPIDQIQIEQTS